VPTSRRAAAAGFFAAVVGDLKIAARRVITSSEKSVSS
jgi:hypothetical protein